MFNGKVQFIGKITQVITLADSIIQVNIQAKDLDYSLLKKGDIMLHNGCSLTVADVMSDYYQVLIYPETLSCTCGLDKVGGILNIEPTLKVGEPLNSNFITGFIDGVAIVRKITPVGECNIVAFELPPELSKFLVRKSLIVVNGVSLTINQVEQNLFEVNLGPRTISATNLGLLVVGAQVNIEIDQIAKYVYHFTRDMVEN